MKIGISRSLPDLAAKASSDFLLRFAADSLLPVKPFHPPSADPFSIFSANSAAFPPRTQWSKAFDLALVAKYLSSSAAGHPPRLSIVPKGNSCRASRCERVRRPTTPVPADHPDYRCRSQFPAAPAQCTSCPSPALPPDAVGNCRCRSAAEINLAGRRKAALVPRPSPAGTSTLPSSGALLKISSSSHE